MVSVSGRDKPTQFNTRIPETLKETIDAHPESNQQIAARALRKEIGLNGQSELDLRIEQKEGRIALVKQEIEELEEELREHESDLEALKQRREEMKTPAEQYDEDLSKLLSKLESGEFDRLIPQMGPVERVASEHGKRPEEVHDDLQDLAVSQDRRIYNTQFMTVREAGEVNIADKQLIGDQTEADFE